MTFIRTYGKSLMAVVATVLTAIVALPSGSITPVEWVTVAIAAVGAAAVFSGPNVPGANYTKTILAILTAVLAYVATVIEQAGGLTTGNWLQIAVLAFGAVGVYAAPHISTLRAFPPVA